MTYNPQFKPHWDILKASRWLLYVSIAVLLRYQSDIQSCEENQLLSAPSARLA